MELTSVVSATMSSSKAFICDLCIILLAGILLVNADDKPNSPKTVAEDGNKGNCSCGAFATSTITPEMPPLISKMPGLEVKCEDEGDATCKNLCVALATATKAKGPDVLCSRLQTADELKLSAFYKICDRPWTYANITAEQPLCCEDSKAKVCPSVEKANTTVNMDIKAKV